MEGGEDWFQLGYVPIIATSLPKPVGRHRQPPPPLFARETCEEQRASGRGVEDAEKRYPHAEGTTRRGPPLQARELKLFS